MKNILLIASLVSFAFAGSAFAAGDAASGKEKSATCAGCHGMDGNAAAPTFPKIAGQGEGYLYKQLMEFKNGKRANATMMAMVAALSEQDMMDLAAFYASQTGKSGKAAEDQVELGQAIYRAGNEGSGVAACAACHGPTGAGNPQAVIQALRFKGFPIYLNTVTDTKGRSRNVYRLGTASRAVIAAGYRAMASGTVTS